MNTINIQEMRMRLKALAVFRELPEDAVIEALCAYLDAVEAANGEAAVSAYARFVARLYESNGGHLAEHVKDICHNSETVYVRMIGSGQTVPDAVERCVREELRTLQMVAELTPEKLWAWTEKPGYLPEFTSGGVQLAESYAHRVANIGVYGYGMYAKNRMFYIDEANEIIPVKHPDKTTLESLVDYETEKCKVLENTRALLEGKPAANMLLVGDAGTGKSSTVKAVVNALYTQGLRIIEVRKEQLRVIPKILDRLASNPLKFILFIDDLTFLKDDDNFNALKAVLEGSVSAKSDNVVIYATSNRRHIIKEKFSDREGDDIHRNDTMQEMLSLSERFGIHVYFQKPDKGTFLHIVRHLAEESGVVLEREEMELRAERFALERGGRSARLARQFVDGLVSQGAVRE